ncbi:unnamed protein product [Macrosiphum euphorbiae]|uniref:Uncharacterized protein n=1 Tax=Macrosiphum euphorbiae TaxID=13131 RepID=A0AAV0VHB9_9HEMI|nr:unnamed protein product [Macrosiphum euphorbiae]
MEKFVGPTTSQPSVGPHTEVDTETFQKTFANSQNSVVRAAVGSRVDSARSGSLTDPRHSHSGRSSVGSRSHPHPSNSLPRRT